MTATVLNTKISEVENKRPDTSNLVTATVLNTKIGEVENKTPNHDKYITTPEFNKLTGESFANLVTENDFDKKLTSVNTRITLNKTKHLEVQKKLNSLLTKDFIFILSRIYFTSNNGSPNMFVYKPTLSVLELKKTRVLNILLAGYQKVYIILNL